MDYRYGYDWNSFTREPIDEISEEQAREQWGERGPSSRSVGCRMMSTARSYIRELDSTYAPGITIPDTPANRASGLAGQPLDGDLVLQVPPQRGPIPQELLDYAELYEVRIIDINGVEYITWAN